MPPAPRAAPSLPLPSPLLIGEKTLNGSSIKVTSPAPPPSLSPLLALSLSPSLLDPKVCFYTIFSATDCERASAQPLPINSTPARTLLLCLLRIRRWQLSLGEGLFNSSI